MKSFLLFTAGILLTFTSVLGQESKELKEAFEEGDYFLAYEAYIDALAFYSKILEEEPDNANVNYKVGLCYLNIDGEKDKAIPFLKKAASNISSDYREGTIKEKKAPGEAIFYLATAYHIHNDFREAIIQYHKYLDIVPSYDTINIHFIKQQIAGCNNAPDMIENRIYFSHTNLGENVNTDRSETDFIISGDGNTIVYASSQKFYDAIFFNRKKADGSWGNRINITPEIKSDGDYYPSGLTYDGKRLLLRMNDKFNSDLYQSELIDGHWTEAKKLSKLINSKYWESHGSYSPDGESIYFTSNRPGGYGGLDIYSIHKDPETNQWSEPVNLGPKVNTKFNEETPYMLPYKSKMIFASQGHKGMGGFDIFCIKVHEDGSFGEAKNMGYSFNTSDDDIFFSPSNGRSGYMSRGDIEDNMGLKDIYFLNVYSNENPRPVSLNGKVTLEGTDKIKEEQVKIIISGKEGVVQETWASSPEGNFDLTETKPGEYSLQVVADGYEGQTKSFQIPANYSKEELNWDLALASTYTEPIILPHIYFGFDSWKLATEEKAKLDKVVEIFKDNPGLQVEIAGHTDAIGSKHHNQRLSKKRAKTVFDYLTDKGTNKDMLEVKAYGEEMFIAINNHPDGSDAPSGRKFNRRVAFFIVGSTNEAIQTEEAEIPEGLEVKK